MSPAPVLRVDPVHPDPEVLGRAAERLAAGEVVAGPSDTVYGLLALPRDTRAVDTLTRLKGRAGPFIVLVRTWEDARAWTRNVPEAVWARLRRVWPGPITVLLPAAAGAPGSAEGKIALRMPDFPILEGLLEAVGAPLFSTSANPRGELPPLETNPVVRAFGEELALILDAGPSQSGPPSTIVDLTTNPPRTLREGRGDAAALLDPLPDGS